VRLRLVTGVFIALVCTLAPESFADQIDAGDQRYVRAKVMAFEQGQLVLRASSGQVVRVAISEVSRIHVDSLGGLADFNTAEQYAAEGDDSRALPRYERAVRLVDGYWTDLIRVRMLQTCDRLGMADKAVFNFIKLIEGRWSGPLVAARLMPDNLPAKRTPEFRRAVEQLDSAVNRSKHEDHRVLAMLLRYELLRRVGDDRAAVMVPTIARLRMPESVRTKRTGQIQFAALAKVFESVATEEHLKWLDRAIADCVDEIVPDLLLLRGRSLLGAAGTREEFIRAGWAFMRVVVHFADDPRAAQGLLEAATVHERIGRPDKAVRLLEECLRHKGAAPAVIDKAQAALERLRSAPQGDKTGSTGG